MARKRYKKRISQKDKQLLQSLEEDPSKLVEIVPCTREEGENDKQYLKKLKQHEKYLRAVHGRKSEKKGLPTPKRESKAKKNKRVHDMKAEKIKKLRALREEKLLEKTMWQDNVAFGEVVLRPPDLREKPPRKSEHKKVEFGKLNFMKQFVSHGNKFSSKSS